MSIVEEKQQINDSPLKISVNDTASPTNSNPDLLNNFKQYLISTVPSVLHCTADILHTYIDTADIERILSNYISDNQQYTLIIHKCNETPTDATTIYLQFDTVYKTVKHCINSVIVLKQINTTVDTKDLYKSLQIIQLSDISIYHTILLLVKHIFLPYNKTVLQLAHDRTQLQIDTTALSPSKRQLQDDTTVVQNNIDANVYTSIQRKLNELTVDLNKFYNDTDIPFVALELHPYIDNYVRKQTAANKSLNVDDLENTSSDILQEIQQRLTEWKRDIMSVTNKKSELKQNSVLYEVMWWNTKDRAIEHIKTQRASKPIELTFQLLIRNNRVFATTSFGADSGLNQSDKIHEISKWLNEFQFKSVLASTTFVELNRAIQISFNNYKKLRTIDYSLNRAIQLMYVFSSDVCKQIVTILNNRKLMSSQYDDFVTQTTECIDVINTWLQLQQQNIDLIRTYNKTRNELLDSITNNNNEEIKLLQQRIDTLCKLRKEHYELYTTIDTTFHNDSYQHTRILQQINTAYSVFDNIDVLNIDSENLEQFNYVINQYKSQIDIVECELEDKIRQLLNTAAQHGSAEMFRVCAQFNALFVRPRIQSAIREYQDQLIVTVKNDITELQSKYDIKYNKSEIKRMNKLHDIPSISGSILWCKQIERQLDTYEQRIESILGKQWSYNIQGQPLKRDIDEFKIKLNPAKLYTAWLQDKQDTIHTVALKGPLLKVSNKNNQLTLTVNFDKRLISFFKEAIQLKRLNMKLPWELISIADEAYSNYPYAMRLDDALRIYNNVCTTIDNDKQLQLLANKLKYNIQQILLSGISLQWLDAKVAQHVTLLGTAALEFNDQIDELLQYTNQANTLITQLITCKPTVAALKHIMTELQSIVNHFDKRQFSNLNEYVAHLNQRIEAALATKLTTMSDYYTDCLTHATTAIQHTKDTTDIMCVHDFVLNELVQLDIIVRSHNIQVEPTLEQARCTLTDIFNTLLCIIVDLPRLHVTNMNEQTGDTGYRSVIQLLSTDTLVKVYTTIESYIGSARTYIDTWSKYGTLWSIDIDTISTQLGNNTQLWERMLVDIKKSRTAIDTTQTQQQFGPLLIDYTNAQQKINLQYDIWYKTILNKLGTICSDSNVLLYNQLDTARTQLEKHIFDMSSVNDIIDTVTLIQTHAAAATQWCEQLNNNTNTEKLLQRNRYNFSAEWIYCERLQGNHTSFKQILDRKLNKLAAEDSTIRRTITDQVAAVEQRIIDIVNEWKVVRPTDGNNTDSSNVQHVLNEFDTKLNKLIDDINKLTIAKQALNIPVQSTALDNRLISIQDELKTLNDVWTALGTVYQQYTQLQQSFFKTIQPSDLRVKLTQLQTDIQALPIHVRQYSAYQTLVTTIRDHINTNAVLIDLSSSTIRSKHEKQLLKLLNITQYSALSDVTLGTLWSCNLQQHSAAIKSIIDISQGECAIETFISELKTKYNALKYELVEYKHKIYIITNWSHLFTSISDWLTDISAMKLSPFYHTFATDGQHWDNQLNSQQLIFDTFVDVQRRYIYLDGIFNNNTDIQQQLPQQYKQYRLLDRDYIRLMRDIYNEPNIDVWCNTDHNLYNTLQTHAETLDSIQSALTLYLNKQRQLFSRFYFVGDEDLLDIIGNSDKPQLIQRYCNKMFTGINHFVLSADNKSIVGVMSKESETVTFVQPVNLTEHTAVTAWLTQVQLQVKHTLLTLLQQAVASIPAAIKSNQTYIEWIDTYPTQVILLATQVYYCTTVESEISNKSLPTVLQSIEHNLNVLAERILQPTSQPILRLRYEQLITDLVHQRDVVRELINSNTNSIQAFIWQKQLKYYLKSDILQCTISRATFEYEFEYIGISEKLVHTPLTDIAYLTLCESLHMRLGGNPFGPAGTGKTETVKSLATALGRHCLVFNCDNNFDSNAMVRIFIGLCQSGCWGCFDEFNRLDQRILSAVSQQILTIQTALKQQSTTVTLNEQTVSMNKNLGLFVTMNPSYAGRSELPDNLKSLFRPIAMISPNNIYIAQVVLYAQGFVYAEQLAQSITQLFELCQDQLTKQTHYDFGLRALKSVLRSAGELKRVEHQLQHANHTEIVNDINTEQILLLRSISATIVPKLIHSDELLFTTLIQSVFVNKTLQPPSVESIKQAAVTYCQQQYYQSTELFVNKLMQLNEIMSLHHGIILVGDTCTGKSSVLNVLKHSLETVNKSTIKQYHIDPKSISKAELFGVLDSATLEWTDGILTHILRTILLNLKNESLQQHWIILDGDVDPEWVENLNSVLDDNKLLTLPNGERLQLTNNIKIIFECNNLQYATLATVSRCGMVYCSTDIVTYDMICYNSALKSRHNSIQHITLKQSVVQRWSHVQTHVADVIDTYLLRNTQQQSTMYTVLKHIATMSHVMPFNVLQAMTAFESLITAAIVKIMEYNESHTDFPYTMEQVHEYIHKYVQYAILWSCAGSLSLSDRVKFATYICDQTKNKSILPNKRDNDTPGQVLLDSYVDIDTQQWSHWSEQVSTIELDPTQILRSDLVIDTIDTARHTDVVTCYASTLRSFILCGPAGSGKSMTLNSVFKSMNEFELVTLNFSSTTTPELILQVLQQYCRFEKTVHGITCSPQQSNKQLIIFCDEINLPTTDKYMTQHVITFIRQCIQYTGYWRNSDKQFVKLERITIIGACNPPTDAGRVELTPRLLRYCPLLFVDFPSQQSLYHIYNTFNRALLKLVPLLRNNSEQLTNAMIDVYIQSQQQFTTELQPHYIYSPRELTRWCRAVYEAVQPLASNNIAFTVNDLIRLWAHEALRLFSDRLVQPSEREWTSQLIDTVATKHFKSIQNVNLTTALQRPILFSHYLNKSYVSVELTALRNNIQQKLKLFYEEQVNIPIVLFDDVIAHILRIDRVLQQPIGHMLLVGASGAGKTMLSKFVAWLNGMSTYQIKMHSKYNSTDFMNDLQSVVIRAGIQHESIVFIFDESNVINTAFLELMNSLLAGGDIPGLFTGQQYQTLLTDIKATAKRNNVLCHTDDEYYRYFIQSVQRYLHVIFTMNPANNDFTNRCHTSPALYNRCVIDWFGEWSTHALIQVGTELLQCIDLTVPRTINNQLQSIDLRTDLVNTFVQIHTAVQHTMNAIAVQTGVQSYVTPRHYLDLIAQFIRLHNIKKDELIKLQIQLNNGVQQLATTEHTIAELQQQLNENEHILAKKQSDASMALEQIVQNKTNAEQQTIELNTLSQQIATQQIEIDSKHASVSEQLAQVEPMIAAAKQSVENIKKSDLDLVCKYPNPPISVKLTLQAVLYILSNGKNYDLEWIECTKLLRKADFIKSVLTYDFNELTDKVKQKVNSTYLSQPETQYDAVFNASQACAPLIQWVRSSLKYSEIIENVKPLKAETAKLQAASTELSNKKVVLEQQQIELNAKIEQLKTDFSALVNQTEIIKNDIQVNKTKLDKSVTLIQNLSTESVRWKSDIANYKAVERNLLGNICYCAAFTIYTGQFTEYHRTQLYTQFTQLLHNNSIDFDESLNVTKYLGTTMSHSIQWHNTENRDNNLYDENYILLNNYKRWPLIIDETNTIINQLIAHNTTQKIVRTTFDDINFIKNLELSIRFGNILIIEHIDNNFDSILNSVLNQEFTTNKNSVEKSIEIGGKSIVYINTFQLYLFSSNPNVTYSADLASRVTLINFSVNQFTVQQKINNLIFSIENSSEFNQKQTLASESVQQHTTLQTLKDELLHTLNEKTNILENDTVFNNLQRIQRETDSCIAKMKQSDELLHNINQYAVQYNEFSSIVSEIYIVITKLKQVNILYQFAYSHYITIVTQSFNNTHNNCKLDNVSERLPVYTKILLLNIFNAYKHSILQRDLYAFAYRLCTLYNKFIKHTSTNDSKLSSDTVQQYINTVYNNNELNLSTINPINLTSISRTTVQPLLLVTSSGTDPFVQYTQANAQRFALGTTVIQQTAMDTIVNALQLGGTVILQNIHMATVEWLQQLNKLLRSSTAIHSDFKLLCSIEYKYVNVVPSSLIEQCITLIYEPATGVHSTMTRLLQSVPSDKFKQLPAERSRLYFLLLWLHTVLLERLRYTPLGWSKIFEFSDIDLQLCIDVLDDIIDSVAQGKANIAPQHIPYDTIHKLLQYVIYGGRIDNTFDSNTLQILLKSLFTVNAYDHNFALATTYNSTGKLTNLLLSPDVITYDSIKQFIDTELNKHNTPELVGLPANANLLLTELHNKQIIQQVALLTTADKALDETVDTDDITLVDNDASVTKTKPDYVLTLGKLATEWLQKLPTHTDILNKSLVHTLQHNTDELQQLNTNPMFRCIQRELTRYSVLLDVVRTDLTLLQQYASNTIRSNNTIRTSLTTLQAQQIPHTWSKHLLDSINTVTVTEWLHALQQRIEHITLLSTMQPSKYNTIEISLGCFIAPQSFIAATKQYTLTQLQQSNHTDIQLQMSVVDKVDNSNISYYITNTVLHGAAYKDTKLTLLTNQLSNSLKLIKLTWSTTVDNTTVTLPVYNNINRSNVLFTVATTVADNNTNVTAMYAQRAVALTLWNTNHTH